MSSRGCGLWSALTLEWRTELYPTLDLLLDLGPTMRYYKNKFPEVDELVMVQVRQIAEMGAYVKLVSPGSLNPASQPANQITLHLSMVQLEYDNIEGMILLAELSRRRIRSIQKLIKVGRNEVVVVLRVDKEKGRLYPQFKSLLIPT